jgi:hypothetical protein
MNRNAHSVSWDEQPLGRKPDHVLALDLGVSQGTVTNERRARGIPCFDPRHRGGKSHAPRGIKWDTVGLGTEPDARIAARLGVDHSAVRRQRVRRGIPRFERA